MQPQHHCVTPSARVYLHPALTHSPQAIKRIQRETGMLVVITATDRRPHLATANGGARGGDAA